MWVCGYVCEVRKCPIRSNALFEQAHLSLMHTTSARVRDSGTLEPFVPAAPPDVTASETHSLRDRQYHLNSDVTIYFINRRRNLFWMPHYPCDQLCFTRLSFVCREACISCDLHRWGSQAEPTRADMEPISTADEENR